MKSKSLLIFLLCFAKTLVGQDSLTVETVQDSTFVTPQYEVVYDDVFLSKKETKWLFKVDFLPLIENLNDYTPNRKHVSLEFERKLLQHFSLNVSASLNDTEFTTYTIPFSFAIEPRVYFSQSKNLNGFYASAVYDYAPNFNSFDKIKSRQGYYTKSNNEYGFNLGIQKRVFNNWYFNYQLGYMVQRSYYKQYPDYQEETYKSFYINNKISFGFAFGGTKKSKIESCNVFRCFVEEKSLLKIDTRGLFQDISSDGFSSVLNVGYERKLGNTSWSIQNEIRLKFAQSTPQYSERNKTELIYSFEPRHYFNMKKRIAQGKSVNNLSGFYYGFGLGGKIRTNKYTQNESTSNLYSNSSKNYMVFSVAKFGLQKRIFKHGFFDIALAPIEFTLQKVDEKSYQRINNKVEIQDFSKDFYPEVSVANVIPFFDFKIGFAF
jgi:hypothetical protein